MKVVLEAYTCVPGSGSDPGAGWEWAAAAAERHEVWALMETSCVDRVRAAVARRPGLRLHAVGVDVPERLAWKQDYARGERTRYLAWQVYAGRLARRLHAEHRFDVAHHVTLCADWMPTGLQALRDVPLVWGPVGGYAPVPWEFARDLGAREFAKELARSAVSGAGRAVFGVPLARRAAATLTMNADVSRRLGGGRLGGRLDGRRVITEPHIALHLDELPPPVDPPAGGPRRAVFAGRLLAWKGAWLAVAALAEDPARDWVLDVYGTGPHEGQLRALVDRLGLADRVRLHGPRPRAELMDSLASADALLFPSMHDSAGWIVAEALALGRPVVCLDRAGPAFLLGDRPGVRVPVAGDVPAGLAAALRDLPRPTDGDTRYDARRLPDLVDRLYREVTGAVPAATADVAGA